MKSSHRLGQILGVSGSTGHPGSRCPYQVCRIAFNGHKDRPPTRHVRDGFGRYCYSKKRMISEAYEEDIRHSEDVGHARGRVAPEKPDVRQAPLPSRLA
jgi:hypothetical protein